MAIASRATTNSIGSIPFDNALSISIDLIIRDALAMSVVLLISDAMPVPEPPPETDKIDCGLIWWYCSAQARARLTIVSEPVLLIYSFESGGITPSGSVLDAQALKIKINRMNKYL